LSFHSLLQEQSSQQLLVCWIFVHDQRHSCS
jgi:hypothetical protein